MPDSEIWKSHTAESIKPGETLPENGRGVKMVGKLKQNEEAQC